MNIKLTETLIKRDTRKLELVVETSATKSQLKSAFTYFQLWQKKYDHIIKSPISIYNNMKLYLIYVDGVVTGEFKEKLKHIKSE